MKYAFNDNGTLRDVVMSDPFLLFPKGYAEQFIEVPDEALTGDFWDGQSVIKPPAPDPQIQINADSLAYLASTDWYVIRMSETGKPVPDDILAARQAAREAIK